MKQGFMRSMLLFMCAGFLMCGGMMIYLGFGELFDRPDAIPQNADQVSGFLDSCQVLYEDGQGKHCRLEYLYYVGGAEYRLETEATLQTLPEYGTRADILYDWTDPQQAILKPGNNAQMLIIAGVVMALCPAVFLCGFLFANGLAGQGAIAVAEVIAGCLCLLFGLIFCLGMFALLFGVVFLAGGAGLLVLGLRRCRAGSTAE